MGLCGNRRQHVRALHLPWLEETASLCPPRMRVPPSQHLAAPRERSPTVSRTTDATPEITGTGFQVSDTVGRFRKQSLAIQKEKRTHE